MVGQSTRRTDDQLAGILDETGSWTVNGASREVLCMAASLRHAIEEARLCMLEYRAVSAVVLRPRTILSSLLAR
jgi:hypothetical protein